MNLWSSELSKLAANAMLAQRISSVNALSAICEATGADVDEVSYACGLDSRIGPRMLKAGPGFGGRSVSSRLMNMTWLMIIRSCFQKDIFNIVYLSESLHLCEVADYWRTIITMNEYQKDRFTKRIISCLFNNLTGKRIAVLGFAFKKNTSDTRESPAIKLVSNFVAEGAEVAIYDPKVAEQQIWRDLVDDGGDLGILKRNVEVCQSAYFACANADAIVVVTEWDEFSNKANAIIQTQKDRSSALVELDHRVESGTSSSDSGVFELQDSLRPQTAWKPEKAYQLSQKLTMDQLNINVAAETHPIICLDWARIAKGMKKPMFVFDGRDILDSAKLEELGFQVETIGKPSSRSWTSYN